MAVAYNMNHGGSRGICLGCVEVLCDVVSRTAWAQDPISETLGGYLSILILSTDPYWGNLV